ncbi:hypothetical protein TRIUR3_33898 [Triticum urartu]|uniref:Uncharacterized protein n=1 Tax=Triticum urartu TaxID=4572 RepID=M7YZN3_TRIUA|nr:hypothetical protein TRIUR3_33898 [Triticum urartu]
MIKSPTGRTPTKICTSLRWYPYFKDCIGTIDGTHVTARVSRSQAVTFRGRKHYTSQNVLVVVDFDLKFTYVLAGWEGSSHDANILSDNISRPDGINIPDGKFYLGDVGYACRPGVLPPFRKTRYHLNEFFDRNYLRTPQELFNLRHSSLRVTIERAFGSLKNSANAAAIFTFQYPPAAALLLLTVESRPTCSALELLVCLPHPPLAHGRGGSGRNRGRAWPRELLDELGDFGADLGRTNRCPPALGFTGRAQVMLPAGFPDLVMLHSPLFILLIPSSFRSRRARHLFDGMLNKTAASGKGHFGDLTDDLLRHVLSFLPAADALQTCVLDTGWRDHWRRTTSLPLIFDQSSFPSSERFKQLVKLFIHIRGNSPLDKCKIVACLDDVEERTYTNTILLIEYALKCQVKELLLSVAVDEDFEFEPLILDAPLISQHLKILHLERFELKRSTLNFSCCSVLEELEMQDCNIDARRISSKSLKRLCITDFCSFPTKFHIRMLRNCEYEDCSCHAYPVDEGVLLHGLSNAVNLELVGDTYFELFIYRWDLECCPIFDKLKTLSLNEWFTTIDLLCILQHSPVLEVLTLQLGSTEKFVRATGAEEKIEQSFVCSHLKVVNIECRKVDEGVHKILKFLSKCGILRDQISITHRFSFQKPMRPLPRSTTEPGGLSSFHP